VEEEKEPEKEPEKEMEVDKEQEKEKEKEPEKELEKEPEKEQPEEGKKEGDEVPHHHHPCLHMLAHARTCSPLIEVPNRLGPTSPAYREGMWMRMGSPKRSLRRSLGRRWRSSPRRSSPRRSSLRRKRRREMRYPITTTPARTCWHMLAHARTCSHMLAHARLL
jgi:hypothetical protein